MSRLAIHLVAGLALAAVMAVALVAIAGRSAAAARPVQHVAAGGAEAEAIVALVAVNDGLRAEMERLDRQIRGTSDGNTSGRLEEMAGSLNSLRVINGSASAVGPGLEVRIGGRFTAATLRDLVNELKSGGAEAMAIDGRRLSLWSSIYQGQNGIVVDGYLLGGQVTLHVIGDVATLREVLARRGGLVALMERDGTTVTVVERTGANEVRLPVSSRSRQFHFAGAR